jgi:hypothetical protein
MIPFSKNLNKCDAVVAEIEKKSIYNTRRRKKCVIFGILKFFINIFSVLFPFEGKNHVFR